MKGSAEVIADLLVALAAEAKLNLQYRSDQRLLKFMGLKDLAHKIKKLGNDAHYFMKLIEKHILFLGGEPAHTVAPITTYTKVSDLLQDALRLETDSCNEYEKFAVTAQQSLDDDTRNKFEHLIKWKHSHIGWLEQQLRLIEDLGEQEYITEHI